MVNRKKRPRTAHDERSEDIGPLVEQLLDGYRRHGLNPRPAALELNWRLATTAAARQAFIADQLQSFGLPRVTAQYTILRDIYFADGSLSQAQIMRMNRISSANVTRLIHGLERAGLVRRDANPGDKRSTIVMLTPEGEAFCQKNVAQIGQGMTELGSCFSDGEIAIFNELLARLHKHIESLAQGSSIQPEPISNGARIQ